MHEKIMASKSQLYLKNETMITIELHIETEGYNTEDTEEIMDALSQYFDDSMKKAEKYFTTKP
ncbi:hypothetical protein [Cellulosilyticum sp. I15G10I2]|uniref:hypothetical protein n=1 Tax=Cellulosilyticum sp. I15G10I2 TaxID=1892843 RepID=UPI00085BF005|nr:hypothetical protein [Cellulosilyticum sp. I15G10I2]